MDIDWTKNLTPDKAQAALDALEGEQGADNGPGSHRDPEATSRAASEDGCGGIGSSREGT
jgi:hypothetical protein